MNAAGEKGEEGVRRASQSRRGGKKALRVIGCDSPPAEVIPCLAAYYGLSVRNSNSDAPEKGSDGLVFSQLMRSLLLYYLILKLKCFYSLHFKLNYKLY